MPTTTHTRDTALRPCAWCGADVGGAHASWRTHRNETICERCYLDNAITCITCERIEHIDDATQCGNCDHYLCDSCYCACDEDDYTPTRVADETTTRYIGAQRGKILQSLRPFGVEIEAVAPDRDAIRAIYDALPSGVGMSRDGSLPHRGIEIQTPRLAGLIGENVIKNIARLLNDEGCAVTRACGLHVHLDTADFTPKNYEAIKRLWLLYIVFEDVFISFLPMSRRANSFCRLIRDAYHVQEILDAASKQELERIWYRVADDTEIRKQKRGKWHHTRYTGLNLHSMFAQRHAEIRYHAGTTNDTKILEWANLHALTFDSAQKGGTPNAILDARYQTDIKKKTRALFAMVGLSKSSQTYFLGRQKLFGNAAAPEAAN